MPYPAFVMVGTLLWQAFLDSLNKPMSSLNNARSMLVKLNFPRIAPVLAGIGETTLTSAVRLVLLIPVFIIAGVVPSWTFIFFPFAYIALVVLGTAIGAFLTPIGMLYSDIGRFIGVGGQLAMYATPVVYPIASAGLLGWVNKLNPITYLIETGRATLVGSTTAGSVISALEETIPDLGRLQVPFRGWFHATTGADLDRHGAVPEHPVQLGPAAEAAGQDPQLQHALTVLGSLKR